MLPVAENLLHCLFDILKFFASLLQEGMRDLLMKYMKSTITYLVYGFAEGVACTMFDVCKGDPVRGWRNGHEQTTAWVEGLKERLKQSRQRTLEMAI